MLNIFPLVLFTLFSPEFSVEIVYPKKKKKNILPCRSYLSVCYSLFLAAEAAGTIKSLQK